jgi:hypothetical protein
MVRQSIDTAIGIASNRPSSPLVKAHLLDPAASAATATSSTHGAASEAAVEPVVQSHSESDEITAASPWKCGELDGGAHRSPSASDSHGGDSVAIETLSSSALIHHESALNVVEWIDQKQSPIEQGSRITPNAQLLQSTNPLSDATEANISVIAMNHVPTTSSAIAPHERAPGARPKIAADLTTPAPASRDTTGLTAKPCTVGGSEDANILIGLGPPRAVNHVQAHHSFFTDSPITAAAAASVPDYKLYDMSLYDIWGNHFNVDYLINNGHKLDSDIAAADLQMCKDIPTFSDSFSIFSSPQHPFHVSKSS